MDHPEDAVTLDTQLAAAFPHLADPKVIEQLAKDPETFKKTGELANYIGHEYGSQECFNNKGLSKKSCNDRFAEAKKILNNDRL